MPLDYHLGVTSSLIDAGDPSVQDPDGSLSDIGAYGGPDGTSWDLDGDGYYDYFWPGTILDAPAGFDPANWDCDDMDPEVQACP